MTPVLEGNQIGSVIESMRWMRKARVARYGTVISHRSGETSEDFIADVTVATNAGRFKTGAPRRGEGVAKFDQLLRLQELGAQARHAGARAAHGAAT